MSDGYHRPVLTDAVLNWLNVRPGMVLVDCTIGGGGHAAAAAAAVDGDLTLIGLDRDPAAINRASERLASRVSDLRLQRRNFRELEPALQSADVGRADALLFDLGLASHQIDTAARGFSYIRDGPLDMRMDPDSETTAADIVNRWTGDELEDIFHRYGEERWARAVVGAILQTREEAAIERTQELVDIVRSAVPAGARRRGHPAKRVFQALRIAVNDELGALRAALEQVPEVLAAGGRLVSIAFHSLEDRMIKRRMQDWERDCICPPDLPVCGCDEVQEMEILTRRAVRADTSEIDANPRAASARLRACERL